MLYDRTNIEGLASFITKRAALMKQSTDIRDDYCDAYCSKKKFHVTHGYGIALPVFRCENFIEGRQCCRADWEGSIPRRLRSFNVTTSDVVAFKTPSGTNRKTITKYLFRILDHKDLDGHFEKTPFIPQFLKIAHRYSLCEGSLPVQEALQLMLSFYLTFRTTFLTSVVDQSGKVQHSKSGLWSHIHAPARIDSCVKKSLVIIWHYLQRKTLYHLSRNYLLLDPFTAYEEDDMQSSKGLQGYSCILLLSSLLLLTWEQYDSDTQDQLVSHYTPVKIGFQRSLVNNLKPNEVGELLVSVHAIVGLFHAMTEAMPSPENWNTQEHNPLFRFDKTTCDMLTELRDLISEHRKHRIYREWWEYDS